MTEVQNEQFGVNLWWTVPVLVMDGDAAQSIVSSKGFEPDEDMPKPSRRNVVGRAARSFQDRRHKEGKCVVEPLRDNATYTSYGILWKKDKGVEETAYEQDTLVRLDKESGRVVAEGPQSEDFFTALDKYSDAITDDDIRKFLRKVVRMCKGISKSPNGGIYFVPDRFVGIIESAQQVLEEMGAGARLYVERVMNGPQERQIVWEAVETEIDKKIADTLHAVERIGKRVSSVHNHETKLGELTELMDIYKGLLGQEAKYEELAERLSDASNEVASKLDKLQKDVTKAPKKGSKKKAASLKAGSVGQQAVAAALKVLTEAGGALHYRDIAKKVEADGLELRGKDGGAWLNSWISETFRGGAESPFKRLGRGLYSIA